SRAVESSAHKSLFLPPPSAAFSPEAAATFLAVRASAVHGVSPSEEVLAGARRHVRAPHPQQTASVYPDLAAGGGSAVRAADRLDARARYRVTARDFP